jgi:hypothetical protein
VIVHYWLRPTINSAVRSFRMSSTVIVGMLRGVALHALLEDEVDFGPLAPNRAVAHSPLMVTVPARRALLIGAWNLSITSK